MRMIQSGVSVIWPYLHRHEDEKEKALLLYLEIIGKVLYDCCWLDFSILYGNFILLLIGR